MSGSLRNLALRGETGGMVLAIRRGDAWTFRPGPEAVISGGDVLLVRGSEEGVRKARDLTAASVVEEPPEPKASPLPGLEQAVDLLVEMKNSAEASVGLAYASLPKGVSISLQ